MTYRIDELVVVPLALLLEKEDRLSTLEAKAFSQAVKHNKRMEEKEQQISELEQQLKNMGARAAVAEQERGHYLEVANCLRLERDQARARANGLPLLSMSQRDLALALNKRDEAIAQRDEAFARAEKAEGELKDLYESNKKVNQESTQSLQQLFYQIDNQKAIIKQKQDLILQGNMSRETLFQQKNKYFNEIKTLKDFSDRLTMERAALLSQIESAGEENIRLRTTLETVLGMKGMGTVARFLENEAK